MIRAAVVAAGCVAIAACSAAKAPPAASPSANASAPAAGAGDPRAQIEALDREITAQLAAAHVAPPPTELCRGARCAEVMSEPFATPLVTEPACRPAPGPRCADACTLASSICDNQDKICALARQLPGDDWAAGTCERARASCRAAHERCCGCA